MNAITTSPLPAPSLERIRGGLRYRFRSTIKSPGLILSSNPSPTGIALLSVLLRARRATLFLFSVALLLAGASAVRGQSGKVGDSALLCHHNA